jgi:hypothetical protein
MRSGIVIQWLTAVVAFAGSQAVAAPWLDPEKAQRQGGLSRHLWSTDLGRMDVTGVRLSAGLAVGLHGSVQAQLRRNVTPALTADLSPDSKLSFLPAGRRGAMLVLHTTR